MQFFRWNFFIESIVANETIFKVTFHKYVMSSPSLRCHGLARRIKRAEQSEERNKEATARWLSFSSSPFCHLTGRYLVAHSDGGGGSGGASDECLMWWWWWLYWSVGVRLPACGINTTAPSISSASPHPYTPLRTITSVRGNGNWRKMLHHQLEFPCTFRICESCGKWAEGFAQLTVLCTDIRIKYMYVYLCFFTFKTPSIRGNQETLPPADDGLPKT